MNSLRVAPDSSVARETGRTEGTEQEITLIWKDESYQRAIEAIGFVMKPLLLDRAKVASLVRDDVVDLITGPVHQHIQRQPTLVHRMIGSTRVYFPIRTNALIQYVENDQSASFGKFIIRDHLPKKPEKMNERLERWKTIPIHQPKPGGHESRFSPETPLAEITKHFRTHVQETPKRIRESLGTNFSNYSKLLNEISRDFLSGNLEGSQVQQKHEHDERELLHEMGRLEQTAMIFENLKIQVEPQEVDAKAISVYSYQGLSPQATDHWLFGNIEIGYQRCPIFALFEDLDGTLANDLKLRFQTHMCAEFHYNPLPFKEPDRSLCIESLLATASTHMESFFRDRRLPSAKSSLIAALVIDNTIWVVNVGPSSAICLDRANIHQLSEFPSPEIRRFYKSMQKRISDSELLYGVQEVIDEEITCTRCISTKSHPGLTSRGKVMKYPIGPEGCMLALVSSGINDVLTTQDIGKVMMQGRSAPFQTAQALVQLGFLNDSQKSLTTLVTQILHH